MRKFMWFSMLALGLAWTGSAHAQLPGMSSMSNVIKIPKSFNLNVTPNISNNSPMDYRNANVPIGGTSYRPNLTGTAFPFRLSSLFSSPTGMNSISATTTFGQSVYPTPAQMQAAAPNYFKAFQMYRAPFIQP